MFDIFDIFWHFSAEQQTFSIERNWPYLFIIWKPRFFLSCSNAILEIFTMFTLEVKSCLHPSNTTYIFQILLYWLYIRNSLKVTWYSCGQIFLPRNKSISYNTNLSSAYHSTNNQYNTIIQYNTSIQTYQSKQSYIAQRSTPRNTLSLRN